MKTSTKSFWALTALVVLGLQGCSHGTAKKLDTKLDQEQSVGTPSELHEQTGELIESAPGLTDVQRKQLLSLRDSTRARLQQLNTDSLKLRSVLIKDVLAEKYDEKEVKLVKKRIKELENKKLSTLFDAIESANKILGRGAARHDTMVQSMFGEPRSARY